jgi:hypothetical protein
MTSEIKSYLSIFKQYKLIAEKAMAQVPDANLATKQHPELNSIETLVLHLSGNMKSRWTDFLTTDGEKPWRNRDLEFIEQHLSRDLLMDHWSQGWDCLFNALEGLNEQDLSLQLVIRSEPHTVREAILRQLSHYPYHVGQIVQLAKEIARENWNSLSIPKGQSEQYNQGKMNS